jgi:hypothetical protein
MKDVFIVPFNFDNPENDDHAIFVDMQMKHDLFLFSYDQVVLSLLSIVYRSKISKSHL